MNTHDDVLQIKDTHQTNKQKVDKSEEERLEPEHFLIHTWPYHSSSSASGDEIIHYGICFPACEVHC